jgi:hypothetical protein
LNHSFIITNDVAKRRVQATRAGLEDCIGIMALFAFAGSRSRATENMGMGEELKRSL